MTLSRTIIRRTLGFPASILAEALFSICLVLSWPNVGGATIIVDQQPLNTNGSASDTAFVSAKQEVWQQIADDFELTQDILLQKVVLWGFYGDNFDKTIEPPPQDETLRLRIYDARPIDGLPGSILKEQMFSNPSRTATGRIIQLGPHPPEQRYELDLGTSFQLQADTPYWLEVVQLGDASSLFRWEVSPGNGTPYAFLNSNIPDWRRTLSVSNMSFQLHSIPEPSTFLCSMTVTSFFIMKRRNVRR
jgi:hypothetical protein